MQPVDELGLRIAHQPVDHRHRRQHLEDAVGLGPQPQGDVGQVGDGDDRDQRGVLEQRHPGRGQRGEHPHRRLRQHDAQHHLAAAHAERQPGVPLALADRQDAGAEGLRVERRDVADQADQRGRDRREQDVGKHRQDVVDPVDLQDQRRGAEELDEGGGRAAHQAEAAEPQEGEQQAAGNGQRHGHDGEEHVELGAFAEQAEIVPDDRPVESHDAPRCATRWYSRSTPRAIG